MINASDAEIVEEQTGPGLAVKGSEKSGNGKMTKSNSFPTLSGVKLQQEQQQLSNDRVVDGISYAMILANAATDECVLPAKPGIQSNNGGRFKELGAIPKRTSKILNTEDTAADTCDEAMEAAEGGAAKIDAEGAVAADEGTGKEKKKFPEFKDSESYLSYHLNRLNLIGTGQDTGIDTTPLPDIPDYCGFPKLINQFTDRRYLEYEQKALIGLLDSLTKGADNV